MALVNIRDLLYHAYENHYAVGGFEIINLEFLRAVITAAEESRSPVILNVIEPHFDMYDVEMLMPAIVAAAKKASVPVAIHMDHCSQPSCVQDAIRMGCNSVMLAEAHTELPHHVSKTHDTVDLAHSCGVCVEGELGHVTGMFPEQSGDEKSVQTTTSEAKYFVKRSGVDFLAISIGTVHGYSNESLRLDYKRLSQINETVGIPLVIHGGTGLSDQQYHKLIDRGVAKINYFTAMADMMIAQTKKNLTQENTGYREMVQGINEILTGEVLRVMQTWRSAGRAAEVMIQCAAWNNVEHVILYNTTDNDLAVIQIMLRKGKQELGTIPGVMDVRIGRARNEKNKYQYCWLVRFTHETVIETYKNHPLHTAYADSYFRPIAADRVTNDFEILDDLDFGAGLSG